MDKQDSFIKRLGNRWAAAAGFTCDPSPRSHIYRLIVVLGVALFLFLQVKDWLTPASWDQTAWYRTAAAEELKHLPMQYGAGKEACYACHEERREEFESGSHLNLACEACHGPGPAHANATEKLADAVVRPEKALCLRCHAQSVARPESFPQYSEGIHAGMGADPTKACQNCHKTHSPKFEMGWGF